MASESTSDTSLGRLREVRHALLRLHKILLDFERTAYERKRGRIQSSYEYLQLVMWDPWFEWLHSISELIVQIDELFDAEEPLTEAGAAALTEQTRHLLTASETGSTFQRKYFKALQASPDVVLAHSSVVKLIGKRSDSRRAIH
jgi:hypothetical protein